MAELAPPLLRVVDSSDNSIVVAEAPIPKLTGGKQTLYEVALATLGEELMHSQIIKTRAVSNVTQQFVRDAPYLGIGVASACCCSNC